MEIPEPLFNTMLFLSHPIADIFKERCSCVLKIKDIPEFTCHRAHV